MTDRTSDVGSASALEVFSRARSARPRSAGTFDAEVSGEWTIGGPNGGYLLALLGRAASSLTDSRDLVAPARVVRAVKGNFAAGSSCSARRASTRSP